ncbi:hypothetical protein H4R33_006593 [Dimargaris cristalligena]|uniref:F-box domain-containing protein n=1 Tax=Dimargaris cristalligena TaxID=215637 RepID=A0A4P9ZL86_9FUNG|nr:hypothetical protein H4R33_006593 [Dimargaris cristalligena]RKP33848.1 hypothetical protein BJ085DRAFT_41584 [Dimargaris cristalligena]|eukprot:RKP33848.1 hypothetical protein BJ085DRAFT_41584 [Dimargaris cristalligena]
MMRPLLFVILATLAHPNPAYSVDIAQFANAFPADIRFNIFKSCSWETQQEWGSTCRDWREDWLREQGQAKLKLVDTFMEQCQKKDIFNTPHLVVEQSMIEASLKLVSLEVYSMFMKFRIQDQLTRVGFTPLGYPLPPDQKAGRLTPLHVQPIIEQSIPLLAAIESQRHRVPLASLSDNWLKTFCPVIYLARQANPYHIKTLAALAYVQLHSADRPIANGLMMTWLKGEHTALAHDLASKEPTGYLRRNLAMAKVANSFLLRERFGHQATQKLLYLIVWALIAHEHWGSLREWVRDGLSILMIATEYQRVPRLIHTLGLQLGHPLEKMQQEWRWKNSHFDPYIVGCARTMGWQRAAGILETELQVAPVTSRTFVCAEELPSGGLLYLSDQDVITFEYFL